ncbi:MAG TPA: beta-ketoacyl-ACP synthase II [Anaerolineales bacterium]|nr:beta-ketoacyl-ACP synthase II [Anaerolineales bacterium]
MDRKVVVTGMGAVSPIGLTVDEAWDSAVEGRSGVGPITLFDASDLGAQIAAEVKGFDPTRYVEPRDARRRDRFELFAAAAVRQAIDQARLKIEPENAGRVAVIVSSAIGGLASIEGAVRTLFDEGPRRLGPFVIPMIMSNGASGMAAIDTGAKGPSFSVASACASSADGLGMAWLLLRAGMADVAIAGGAEATITRVGIATFDRVGAMSHRNADYHTTPSPFDLHRDGLVMGEGAAALILETEEHAAARGATVLAELAGYGSSADAFHVTAPAEDGAGGAAAIRLALQMAGAAPEAVDYINAHGTGTKLNDLSETRSIKAALGETAHRVPVSSTKSMTGHMMGATGALEAVFCVQAIRTGLIPPTIHLTTPDPECDLDYVPNLARKAQVRLALSNAFGFGGHNAVLAFRMIST